MEAGPLRVTIFSSDSILEVLAGLGGRASKRRLRTELRRRGFEFIDDELDFHFSQLLRTGRVRLLIGEESRLEDVYELQRR